MITVIHIMQVMGINRMNTLIQRLYQQESIADFVERQFRKVSHTHICTLGMYIILCAVVAVLYITRNIYSQYMHIIQIMYKIIIIIIIISKRSGIMAVGGIGSFSALTSYSRVNSSKANSELEFDKIYQQKTDSVEINSTAGNNDIMTIYEMLCSEFPEANYILEDRSDEENLFFNNVDTRIGKDFGNPSKKNVFIDVSVIKKIQEDPSYYVEAKRALEHLFEHYDEKRIHEGLNLPYTTGNLNFENDRMQVSYTNDVGSCQEMVEREVKKLQNPKLSDTINYEYVKDKIDTMLDDFMDEVTEGIVGKDKEER